MSDLGRSIPGGGEVGQWVWMPDRRRCWNRDLIAELAHRSGDWLSNRTASQGTWRTYSDDLGLPYLLASVEDGGEIAEAVRQRCGVVLPVHEPSPRNTTWHVSFLPWLSRRGIDPWGSQVCAVVPEWGRELAGLGDVPDHVWSGDAQRTVPTASAFARRRAASVRSYYRWHHAMGLTACSPADIWTPKAAGIPAQPAFRDVTDDLDRDDLARIQVAADAHSGVDGDRELAAAVVAVMTSTACRAVEVSRMDLRDYDRTARRGPVVRLWTKGRDERWIPIDTETADRIDRWVAWRPDLAPFGRTAAGRVQAGRGLPHRVPLFSTLGGPRGALAWAQRAQEGHPGRLSTHSVGDLLRRVCARAAHPVVSELASWIHPHAIRAAVATDLLDQGWPLVEVQRLLGHRSATTTAQYDRHASDRHLPAATAAASRQSIAVEAAKRRALTR